MIETNIPEINVEELMRRVKEEVKNHQGSVHPTRNNGLGSSDVNNQLNMTRLESLIHDAETRSQPRTQWPKQLNRFPFNRSGRLQRYVLKLFDLFFRDQRSVNHSLIQIIRELLRINQDLNNHIGMLTQLVNTNGSGSIQIQLQMLRKENGEYAKKVQELTESQIKSAQNIKTVEERINTIDNRYAQNDSFIKNDLIQQKHLITLFLEEAHRSTSQPLSEEQFRAFSQEEKHSLDALYAAFEERFRGTRTEIKNRLKVYLPLIQESKVGGSDSPILDLGCGRGEWLELMRDTGLIAQGVDINRVFINQCQEFKLNVIEKDLSSYLKSLPNESLGAVTGFHIIEHLSFEVLVQLLDEVLRVLKPGGLVIFETPNPQNILVGSHNFYVDPTHRNPLPSSLIKFLCEIRGLMRLEIMYLHPYEETYRMHGSNIAEKFSDYFYGPQDYALIGYKM